LEYQAWLHDLYALALDPPNAAPGPLASDAGGVVFENGAMCGLFIWQKWGPLALQKLAWYLSS
jgi:hypothetical protein